MQWTASIIALVASAALVSAAPAPDAQSPDAGGQTMTLVSASGKNSAVTIGDYGTDTKKAAAVRELSLIMARTAVPNCKGSSYCSNGQSFKNECAAAQNSLQPTTYTSGGDKAGVCSGGCGLFVQGSKDRNGNACAVKGTDLYEGFNQILGNGCQTCGSVAAPVGGDCIITVNYVSGCSA